MKRLFILLWLLIEFLSGISVSAAENYILGRAADIKYEDFSLNSDIQQIKQIIDVELLTGEHRGETIQTENIVGQNPYYDINVRLNNKLILFAENDNGLQKLYISDLYRSGVLSFLGGIFCLLVIITGRKRGIYSIISIASTIILIFFVLCPMILNGASPLGSTILVCLLSTVITMYFVGGFNYKSTAASAGTIISLIIAGLLAGITIKFAHLTGFADEISLYLYSSHPELDFTSITASVIILAALGAVMDIAMSIASTVNEIYLNNNLLTVKELFSAGMNVGRDIIGTMANTLILVYMGGALPLLLLAGEIDTYKFFNLNTVATEISSAIIGSIALLLCVPITAIISANLTKISGAKTKKRDIIKLDNKI